MGWLTAFPDSRMVIRNEVISGDTILQEFTFEGTHTATLHAPTGDLPATNRRLSGRGAQVIKVRDGLVADTQLYFDQVDVLTQLGLMPVAAAAR
jgi:predicted ester cyclase